MACDKEPLSLDRSIDVDTATVNKADRGIHANVSTFKKPTGLVGSKRSVSEHKGETHAQQIQQNDDRASSQEPPLQYAEPSWGGKPDENYKIEILKSGVIVETVQLTDRSFYVIGRLPSCHISLAHPSISRYHAVLQYRSKEGEDSHKGFYVYDLESTHGTYWNGSLIKPHIYVRVQGGHMLRFGFSQRIYLLQAPDHDQEDESRYSVTELKMLRALKSEEISASKDPTRADNKEDEGIDWGMGEDAVEEADLEENPYADAADEDLVLDDPKKTLRGWFEREGFSLRYDTEEKGVGQFLCRVVLPLEDIVGHTLRAEALVKGKKKEAVVQCALEACKILDKHGLLRQANHEGRKRKARNWEAEDYYDSDEDNFLDRTGSVEKKREQRMKLAGKLEDKAETYDTLLEKRDKVAKRIAQLTTTIDNWQHAKDTKDEQTEEDALDAFMSSLSSTALTKSDITNMKFELQNLKKEEASLDKLLNLTRPANLPSLSSNGATRPTEAKTVTGSAVRPKKVAPPADVHPICKTTMEVESENVAVEEEEEEVEEEEEEEEEADSKDDEKRPANEPASLTGPLPSETKRPDRVPDRDTDVPIGGNDNRNKRQTAVASKRCDERQNVYSEQDVYKDNYSTWIPPQDQVGDGRTSLNEKYGY